NNPDNPIINIRSFGENPEDVSAYGTAFIAGARSNTSSRVLTTAKHFPGHGDTATDTHMNLATISGDKARLEQIEWVPFRAAIKNNVDAVMTAHIAVPALDASDVPSTLSSKILTGILRDEMDFKGLIVTDALEMGGIVHEFSSGDAAVRAIEAGVDVLLMPPDPEAAIDGLVAAVKSGRISQKRIDQSVTRILQAKARVGLGTKKLVSLEAIHSVVNAPESNARAQQICDRAVTLLRNQNDLIPLRSTASTAFVVLVEAHSSIEGQAFTQEVRKRVPAANIIQVDGAMSDEDLDAAVQRVGTSEQIVVAAFASVAAYRGNVALGGGFPQMVQSLIATKKPLVLISLGNPYVIRNFPEVGAYFTTYSTVPPAEVSAVKALFGEITMGGKLPVTIPGIAQYGDGITLGAIHPIQASR
ncbi:MAG: glycoside hydrolase family 3 C-terminal domain-containing protein, partial [Acidobacteriaceae bacterium]|nr:glycoside hydrolase family 3 C-terminal domain-containing protein [Acidobacteriaceae bacterium]